MSGMRLSMRVWDLPVRCFHWLMPLLLIGSYLTMWTHHFGWHIRIGEALLVLLIWRVIWGFVGSDTARFRSFLRRPATGLGHLARIGQREVDNEVGHNAAGGWWVLVMLVLLGVQILAGLLASDHYDKGGPLFHLVPASVARLAADVHGVNFYLLLGAIVVHLLAVLAYAVFKRQNLLRPMISGKKRMPAAMRAPRMASVALAGLILFCAAAAVTLLIDGLGR